MKLIFIVITLIGLVTISMAIEQDEDVDPFDSLTNCVTFYTAQHDIFSLTVPFRLWAFPLESDGLLSSPTPAGKDFRLFFVEAGVNEKGDKDYKGLYVYKEDKATKLLDHGTDVAAAFDGAIYFSAKDGIYVYNAEENKAERYGSVTDNIIGIVKENGTDIFYILTDDRVLYKVRDGGNEKNKIDDVKNAQKIVMDNANNLYYYDQDNQIYVITDDKPKKVGTPIPKNFDIFKPPFDLSTGIIVYIGEVNNILFPDGGGDSRSEILRGGQPTGYTELSGRIGFYAYGKIICERNSIFNLASLIDRLIKSKAVQ